MAYNIDRSNLDPFYRYKMPRLLAKVEGKGNGIKTVMVNMPEIAKALARPPTYPTKFFGCELGAQTQFDLKNDRFIVNGSHDSEKLQSLLDSFIKKFVLCPECSNPETNLIVQPKKQLILQRCIACGHQGNVDMNHKLTTFILKNPPDQDTSATTPSKGKGKKSGKKKDEKRSNGDKDDDDKDRASPEANAQQQMAAQRATGGVIEAPPEMEDEFGDEDWGEAVDETSVRRRMEELSEAAKGLTVSADLEKSPEERLDIFYAFVKKRHEEGKVLSSAKEILNEAERLEVKDKAAMILVELLLNEKIIQQMKDYKNLFLMFCANHQKAQKYLLGGLEQLMGNVHKATLLPKAAHILKGFYDLDILEEEVIIDWSKKASKKYVSKSVAEEIHEKAQPFIKWLMEAEEETDDDSEEEEDEEDGHLEVAFSTTEKIGTKAEPAPAKVSSPCKKEDKEDEDIDIDAI